jgi:arylsulfatase
MSVTFAALLFAQSTWAQEKKPNILVIMGDDIGWFNPSCYNSGVMGYRTPNIDRIAAEGARFTDWYGQQSCTAGRAAFVHRPVADSHRADQGRSARRGHRPLRQGPSVAEFLKQLGYATGQFGKNHLGDKDEFLPTKHGFDEFFGNLYHLNAEEEPENPDYPKNPEFKKKFGPRGVLKCTADGKIEDTGPLTKKRMETVDEEFLAAALDFMDRQNKASKPFFCWFNSTRMHIFTHLKKESDGKTGLGSTPTAWSSTTAWWGNCCRAGRSEIADNTIVVYTTDNGAEVFTWPDGGTTPFRGEKATNWEGAFRVPMCIRWPGVIKPGQVINDLCAHEDLIPTFAAAAGEPDSSPRCSRATRPTGRLQGPPRRLQPHALPKGEVKESPRKEFIYWSD